MPKVVTAARVGLKFQDVFGPLGPEHHVTIHHTAGPIDQNYEHATRLIRSYHAAHKAKGWGGIGYHYCILRSGTIIGLRPTRLKGAHVGGHNSQNIGVMFHGTTGDEPTQKQIDSFEWLLRNAHRSVMPKAHRTDRPLRRPFCERRQHNQWSGHGFNACAGTIGDIIMRRAG
jgi:hypothetical protein